MSLHLNFEPHSWYKGWAIKDERKFLRTEQGKGGRWLAVTANGNTGYIEELMADTLKELKESINVRIDTLAERDRYNRQRLSKKV